MSSLTAPNPGFTIETLDVTVQTVPIPTPVRTSFGTMSERPAIFLRVRDVSGAIGYGEIWCNFPACGAPHRAALTETEIAPRMLGLPFDGPQALFEHLTRSTQRTALQTGEIGPFAQCIAGLDIAIWDMLARRANQPLFRYLGGIHPNVPVYASGINPTAVADTGRRLIDEGHTRLKLKVGFDDAKDRVNVASLRELLPDGDLMIDANQAWDIDKALTEIKALRAHNLLWVEEPVMVNTPPRAWQQLQRATGQRLAAGENFATMDEFDVALAGDWLGVMQPDICKWGGLTGCYDVLERAKAAGMMTCPHSLGGGIALAGSMHLWAALNGTGFVEMDGNPNPLRQDICPTVVRSGSVHLDDAPGLGVDTDQLNTFFEN